jgi:hypothetical protein
MIPKTNPQKLFQYSQNDFPNIDGFSDYSFPITNNFQLFISTGYWGEHDPGEIHTVLLVLDLKTGKEINRIKIVTKGYDAVYGGLPLIQRAGSILLPVRQRHSSLQVLQISPNGEILQTDEFGYENSEDKRVEMCLLNSDLGDKVGLSPLVDVSDDTYLFSWLYRTRSYRMECRKLGRKEALWSALEWILGATEKVVLNVTNPNPRIWAYHIENFVFGKNKPDLSNYQLVARNKLNGKILWSLPAAHSLLAAVNSQSFLILDRTERVLEDAYRKDEFESEWITQSDLIPDFPEPDEYAVEFNRRHPLTACSTLKMIEENGNELWRQELKGDVLSAICNLMYSCMILTSENGSGQILCLSSEGKILWGKAIDGISYWANWPPSSNTWPVLIALDQENLLWGTKTKLVCSSLENNGEIVWQLDIPEEIMIYDRWLRPHDQHINKPGVMVADGKIFTKCDQVPELWKVYSDGRSET